MSSPASGDVAQGRETCSFCPKLCRHACPVAEAEGTEQATPTYKQQVALQAASGVRALDPERARVLYKCSDCSSTSVACRHRVQVGDSLLEARAQAVREGHAPAEMQALSRRFQETGSPYRADLSRRAQAGRPRRGEIGVFPACTTLAHEPDGFPRVMLLLDLTRTEVTTALSDPPCCGYPLLAAGLVEQFREHAQRVAKSLQSFERIAVEGAGCAHTLRTRYREHGVKLRPSVAPLVDLLAANTEGWQKLSPEAPAEKTYAYHDPCTLARRLGRIEEPRAVLRAALGKRAVELGERGPETRCSGGGGVYPLTHPVEARRCGERVAELAAEVSADVLVTGCPSAARRLRLANPDLEVQTLDQVLAERILDPNRHREGSPDST